MHISNATSSSSLSWLAPRRLSRSRGPCARAPLRGIRRGHMQHACRDAALAMLLGCTVHDDGRAPVGARQRMRTKMRLGLIRATSSPSGKLWIRTGTSCDERLVRSSDTFT